MLYLLSPQNLTQKGRWTRKQREPAQSHCSGHSTKSKQREETGEGELDFQKSFHVMSIAINGHW